MGRLLRLLVAAVAIAAGWSASAAATEASRVLVAAVPRFFPPQYQVDGEGRPYGFAIEVMDKIAERAGFTVAYRVFDDWPSVLQALHTGQVDLMPNMGITPLRQTQFAFSAPVETAPISVFVRADTSRIDGWAGLAGHRVGVVPGSSGSEAVAQRRDIEVIEYPTYVETLYALVSGQVDAIVQPEPVTWHTAREGRLGEHVKVAGPPVLEVRRAVALRRDSPLLPELDAAVRAFVGSPDYQEIFARWHGTPQPFWTAPSVAAAMAALLLLSVAATGAWRYQSVMRLNRDLARSQARLRKINGALAALVGCNQVLVRAADESAMLDQVARVIGTNLGCRAVRIELFGPDAPVAAEWRAVAAADPDWTVCLLLDADERLGTIHIEPEDREGFDAEQVTLVHQLAEDIAFGIANLRNREQKRQADLALRHSEVRFRNLVDNLSDWVWEIDEEGRYTFVSAKVREILGYQPHELIGRTPFDLMPPEEARRVAELFGGFAASQAGFQDLENLNVSKSGEPVVLETSGVPILDQDGRFRGYRGVDRDISERKRAEAALLWEAEVRGVFAELGRLLLGRVPISAVSEMIVERGCRLTESRFGSACFRDRRTGRMVCATPGTANLCDSCAALEGAGALLSNEPGVDWVRLLSVPVIIDGRAAGRLTFADADRPFGPKDMELAERLAITYGLALRRAWDEEALVESRTILETVTAAAQDGIIMMDGAGRITFWNQAAADIFGYGADEIVGRPMREAAIAESDAAEFDRRFVRLLHDSDGAAEAGGEVLGRRKDGAPVPLELALVPARVGEQWSVVATVKDLTERKAAERLRLEMQKQLFQAQKMDALGTLAGGIAHNFNNMLLPVMALTELTMMEMEEGSPGRKRLEAVLQASRRARDLVARILTFGRHDELAMEPIALGELVDETVELLRSALPSSIELEARLEALPAPVMADRTQIQAVLMNLGSNAADAIEGHGQIFVALEPVLVDAALGARLDGLAPGPYARLSLQDTGHGMDEDTIPRIFDPFFTTKGVGKGTGLGLATVQAIVAGHRGAIAVASRPGEGTRFDVYLPLAAVEAAAG